jgi:hypothetical protein
VALLVVLIVAVAVVVLVMRAAAAPGRAGRRSAPHPKQHPARGQRPVPRPIAPDDDPEFLRELSKRTRRDDSAA